MRGCLFAVIMLTSGLITSYTLNNKASPLPGRFEVVLYTMSVCDACALFETDIAAPYKSHELAKTAPMRVINMDANGSGPYHLKQPITQVPTAIIMKDGKEVTRLPGLMDKFFFFAFIRDVTALKWPS